MEIKDRLRSLREEKGLTLTIAFVVFSGASRTFVRVYVGLSRNQT